MGPVHLLDVNMIFSNDVALETKIQSKILFVHEVAANKSTLEDPALSFAVYRMLGIAA